MEQGNNDRKYYLAILVIDMALLLTLSSGIYFLFYWLWPETLADLQWTSLMFTLTLSFVMSFAIYPPMAQRRTVSTEDMVGKIVKTCILFTLLAISITVFIRPAEHFPRTFFVTFCTSSPVALCIERIIVRKLFIALRMKRRNLKNIVLIGKDKIVTELHDILVNPLYGYNIEAVFYDGTCDNERYAVRKTGDTSEMLEWLTKHNYINELYISSAEFDRSNIRFINKFCDNHLIRFYQVPSVMIRGKDVTLYMKENIPVIASRNEPLTDPINKLTKRAFDFIVSSVFLVCVYPFIYIVVALIIKKKSPGPVYFKQERTGMDGKVFECIKFRSMKVNDDSDTIQATKDDPRKYPFGDFMRRTNIDELPQIINVWKGEMSFVGPRPHMLKHTEEYSRLINKFMVRHLAKPGITGLAQVSGFRGETKYVEQMEGRVRKDIEYIENWTFWLDIKIIFKTLANMIGGEKNAY